MRRGPRQLRTPKPTDVEALENELEALRTQQIALRQQLREARQGGAGLGKLEAKLAKQFAEAKWTVQQIQAPQPEWDDVGFYQSVQAKEPRHGGGGHGELSRGRKSRLQNNYPQRRFRR